MIYEMRVYTLQPGKTAAFQELIEKEALPVISKYSKLVGWWSTEVGPLNEVRAHLGIRGPESPRTGPQSPRR
jgi:NIPSNAP